MFDKWYNYPFGKSSVQCKHKKTYEVIEKKTAFSRALAGYPINMITKCVNCKIIIK